MGAGCFTVLASRLGALRRPHPGRTVPPTPPRALSRRVVTQLERIVIDHIEHVLTGQLLGCSALATRRSASCFQMTL